MAWPDKIHMPGRTSVQRQPASLRALQHPEDSCLPPCRRSRALSRPPPRQISPSLSPSRRLGGGGRGAALLHPLVRRRILARRGSSGEGAQGRNSFLMVLFYRSRRRGRGVSYRRSVRQRARLPRGHEAAVFSDRVKRLRWRGRKDVCP